MRLILGLAIFLFASTGFAADAPVRKQSRQPVAKISATKPVRTKAQSLGQLKKIVVMPGMTEGAKRVKVLRTEHKANSVNNSVTEKPCSEKNPGFSTTEYEIKGFAEGPRGTAIF